MQTKIRSQRTGQTVRTVEVDTNPETGKPYRKAELAAILAGVHGVDSLWFRQLMKYTLGELQQRVTAKRSYRHKQTVPTGSVHRHDFQADIYGGQYKVTGFDDVTGIYTTVTLPPDDKTIEAIITAVVEGHYYVAPGEDRAVKAEEEIQDRIARAGRESKIRFVSAAAYAELF